MGNSTSLGLGGSETHDRRDMVDDGIEDGGRPPEVVEEKPLEEPPNQNPPQWRPTDGAEAIRVETENHKPRKVLSHWYPPCKAEEIRVHEADFKDHHDVGTDQDDPHWRPNYGVEGLRATRERPMIDGRTAERTMGPEVQMDNRITQLTPITGRRGTVCGTSTNSILQGPIGLML